MNSSCPVVDFHDPVMLANPHAFLAELRATAPVVRARDADGHEYYLVSSYRLIEEVTRRTADFSNRMQHLLFAGRTMSPAVAEVLASVPFRAGSLLVTDDPEHARHRALVNAGFARGRIADLTPSIQRLTDELIDAFIADGECDFVNQFAVLLPTYVIADILGLERKDYSLVRTWSDAAIAIVSRMGSEEQELANAKMVTEFRRFILETTARRRREPSDDVFSSLIQARVEGMEPLTDEEIAPITMEIAVAGNETTRNTLMSGLVQLLRHPEQLQAMRDDPALVPNVVEELLRYETPATAMWRIAAHDTELGGVAIPAGAEIMLRFDAANRDPAVFTDPDRFDVHRTNALRHCSFGAPGIHRCLGQMLARKELQIAVPRLFERLKNIRVIAERSNTDYWPGLLHRGIGSLHIAFDKE